MTRVILFVSYLCLFIPISVLSKIAGVKYLDTKIEKDKKTYWNYRDLKKESRMETYQKQF